MLQRIGGGNAIDLTKDSGFNNYQATYSPNGELIAFRSDRDGGGIFLMGSTGESVRRLTNFGYNPVWSHGGDKILFATESVELPYSRATSQLWTADLKNGATRKFMTEMRYNRPGRLTENGLLSGACRKEQAKDQFGLCRQTVKIRG